MNFKNFKTGFTAVAVLSAAFTVTNVFAQTAPVTTPTAVPATADGLTPFAQVRLWAGYIRQSKETNTAGKSDLDWHSKITTARVGLKGKYANLEGVAEIGLSNYGSTTSNTVSTRKIYGVYSITPDVKFLFGQDDAPYTYYSNSASNDDINGGFGATNNDRELQLKLTAFGAYVDVFNPKTPAYGSAATPLNANIPAKYWDIIIPKVAIGYDLITKNKSVSVGIGAAYQTAKVDRLDDTTAGDLPYELNGKSLNAYLGYVHGKIVLGDLYTQFNLGYGQNTSNLGLSYSNGFQNAATSASALKGISPAVEINSTTTGFSNTTSFEGYLELGYDLKIFQIVAGTGYVQAKNSRWSKTDSQIEYYGQLNIPVIEKRLFFKPEVQYRDYKKDKSGVKQGNELLAGVFIQAVY